jgi:hypothetical protein
MDKINGYDVATQCIIDEKKYFIDIPMCCQPMSQAWNSIIKDLMLGNILIDVILTRIKVQDLKFGKWTLLKKVQVRSFNLGTNQKP